MKLLICFIKPQINTEELNMKVKPTNSLESQPGPTKQRFYLRICPSRYLHRSHSGPRSSSSESEKTETVWLKSHLTKHDTTYLRLHYTPTQRNYVSANLTQTPWTPDLSHKAFTLRLLCYVSGSSSHQIGCFLGFFYVSRWSWTGFQDWGFIITPNDLVLFP